MVRYLIVASRTHSDLYGHLQRQFAEDGEVEVLLDRRHEERRRREEPQDRDRRRGDRRSGRGKDPGLHYHGFLVVRQLPRGSWTQMQWRPPWWDSGKPGEPAVLDRSQQSSDPQTIEARNRVTGWITEGQRMLGVVSKLLGEYGQVSARAETAERKCERLEKEMKTLRNEIEHFRREQRQFAETLKTMARQLVKSAGETS